MRLLLQSLIFAAVLVLLLLAAPSANAYSCVSNATGNWNAAGTWTACNSGIPTATDTVEIRGAHVVTVNVADAVATSVRVGSTVAASTCSLVFAAASHLTVSGATTLSGSAAGRNGTITMNAGGTLTTTGLVLGAGTPTINPGAGTVELTATNILPAAFTFNNLSITAGTTTLGGATSVSGTLTQTGNIAVGTFTLTVSGTHVAGTSTVSGAGGYTLASAATLQSGSATGINGNITTTTRTLNTAANYTFNGVAAQVTGAAMPATVNNLTINNAAGVTLSQNTVTSGSLAVTAGTFTVGAFTYSVTGATTVSGTLSITSTTGTKTFTGNVTINNGGTWNETVNEIIAFGGSLQNNGTFTAGTAVHTFSGTTQTISGANVIAIPSLTISGTTTNNATLTVSTTLAGGSTLTNGAAGTLNFGGASITPTLTATAAGNTVNYNLAGTQTVKATTYSNLILSGNGTKTAAGIITVANLTVNTGAVFNTGATSTWTLTVSGATSVSGTLDLTNAAAKTFTGDITVNSGGILSIDNTTSTIIAGNITVSSGGLMRHYVNYVSANIITMTGNLDISGTYDYTGFTPAIFMNAPSGTRTIKTGTSSVFYLLLRTATYNAVGPVTVDGPFYAMWNVNAGSFHTNGQTVIANWGVVNSGGTLFVDGGSLTINGANGGLLSGFAAGGANAAVTVSSGTLNTTGINMGSSPLVSTFTHSGGTITTPYLTIDNTSTFTCSNSPTLTVNGSLTLTSGTFTTATAGAPAINISGSLVIGSAGTFTNVAASNPVITINGSVINAGVLTPVGTAAINVKGDWANNGTSTATGGTVTFNGTVNQAIGGTSITTFGSLVINPSAGITVSVTNNISVLSNLTISAGILSANSSNMAVGGNWTNNAATTGFTAGSGTVTFNGTAAQAVAGSFATTFNNLTISNTGNTVTLSIDASVAGNLSVTSGTFDLGAFTANRASAGGGTLSTSGTATLKIGGTNTIPSDYLTHSITGISTIEYSGTNQTVVVLNSSQNYQGLTVSGSGTKTLAGEVTVFGNLTLTSGILTTGAYTLNNATGSVFRTSGWVNGNLEMRVATGASPSRLFHVGDATNYTPVNLVFTTVTTAGDLTVSVAASDHPNIGTSNINVAMSVNRTWTITNTGTAMVYASYGATFTFVAGDIDGGASFASFGVGNYSGGSWTTPYPTVGSKTATTTQATGLQTFGGFQIGEVFGTKTFTGTGNFSTAARWTGGTLPTAGENLVIDGACTVDNNGGTDNVAYGTLTIGTATGRTLDWAAGGTNRLNVSNVSAGGGASTLEMTNDGTLIIRGTWTSTNLTFTPGAGTIETQSTITLPAAYATYNNLTVNGSGITVSLPATTTVTGNVTITAGTFSANNSNLSVAGNWTNNAAFTAGAANVTFNGSGAQAIGGTSVTTFNNIIFNKPVGIIATLTGHIGIEGDLTVTSGTVDTQTFSCNRNPMNPGGTATVGNSATFIIGGDNAPGFFTTYMLADSSTIIWEGTTPAWVAGSTAVELVYGNLIIRGTGVKTLAPTHVLNVNGNLTLESGATFDSGSETTTVKGNWINNGATFLPNSNAVVFSGTGAQSIGGSAVTTFNSLTVAGSGTKTLGRDVNVAGTLLFTDGTITTGANTLYATGMVTRVSGHVIGNLKKNVATGATSKTFEIGDASNFTPATVAFASVTTAGDLTASVVSGDHASIGSSTINPAKSVNRNWTLTNSGTVFTSYDVTFTFAAGNIDAGANTSAFFIGKYNGTSWTYPAVGVKTSTTTQATGLTSFSDFQIGESGLSISGHIEDTSSAAISGVTITLSGGSSGSTTTDSSGNYSFGALTPGLNYTVTPAKYNYAFSPVDLSYNNLTASQTAADFTGTDFSGHAPSLNAAASFAVLAATTVTSTGLTVITGNVGVSPGTAVTGFGPGVIQGGQIYSGSGSLAGPAQASALTAYNDLAAQECLPANNLSGKELGVTPGAVTLGPGVYCFPAGALLSSTLTLDDGGDPNAVFIFKIGTTLTTASYSQVVMSSGGPGTNVFWQIGTSATLGTFSALRGNIIASTSITATTGVSVTGRLFALDGAVTMDTNNVNALQVTPNVELFNSVTPSGTLSPGTDLVYTVAFTNDGDQAAANFIIVDPIPPNTDFKLGSPSTTLGTTGMTVTIAYSNDDGVSYTYTPVSGGGSVPAGYAPAGYDRNVTHIRWLFGGSLSQTAPNNSGSISFAAQIR